MSDQWPDITVYDGDWTEAEPVGIPVFSSPIRSTTAEYTFTQDWVILRKNFKPTALNTRHPSAGQDPDYSDWRLVAEGPRQDIGGGVVKWQRSYAKVPDRHDEFESYSYPFIGFYGSVISTATPAGSITTATGRGRTPYLVTSKVRHEYFLTGPNTAYLLPGDIPILKAMRYFAGDDPTPTEGVETDFIMDALGPIPATSPSRTTYNGWVQNAIAYGWRSGEIDTNTPADWAEIENPGQFLAEDSRLTRWRGNIFIRIARYVLAQ